MARSHDRTRVLAVVVAALLALPAAGAAAGSDPDHDGLSGRSEARHHCNPHRADTDGDGMPDRYEVRRRFHCNDRRDAVRDADHDGLTNLDEYRGGTDPRSQDTDGDGLSDTAERRLGTRPGSADSDGDGLSDGAEVRQSGSDPLVFDSDGDGLSDGTEASSTHTSPTKADSDGDGLGDGTERDYTHTDPNRVDTDGDGLGDGAELGHRTDPTKADSDGDGLSDSVELDFALTDPLDSDTDGDGKADGETPHVTADPGTYPAFDPDVLDYVVHCKDGEPLALHVAAPAGGTVSLDGGKAAAGAAADLELTTGQATSFTIVAGSVTRTYGVRCLPSDFPPFTVSRPGTPQAEWYITTPGNYVAIFDNHGVPVWWKGEPLPPSDATLLPNGHLAWYTPHVAGSGAFGMDPTAGFQERGLDGSLAHTWFAVGGNDHPTDVHDFQLLQNSHVLLATYTPRPGTVDVTPYKPNNPPQNGNVTVYDCVIQELDADGHVVWSWNTKDHIDLSETGRWWQKQFGRRPLPDGRTAWDVFHLNSFEDHGDHLLLSLRHTDAIYDVRKSDGAVLWKLGGTTTAQSLTLVGDDTYKSTDFGGQHDARELTDGTVTIHENGTDLGREPRVMRFAIDTAARTGTVLEQLHDPDTLSSFCCGSARRLPGGDWVVSWGGIPRVTELNSAGARVFLLDFVSPVINYRAQPVLPGVLARADLRAGMDAMYPRP